MGHGSLTPIARQDMFLIRPLEYVVLFAEQQILVPAHQPILVRQDFFVIIPLESVFINDWDNISDLFDEIKFHSCYLFLN